MPQLCSNFRIPDLPRLFSNFPSRRFRGSRRRCRAKEEGSRWKRPAWLLPQEICGRGHPLFVQNLATKIATRMGHTWKSRKLVHNWRIAGIVVAPPPRTIACRSQGSRRRCRAKEAGSRWSHSAATEECLARKNLFLPRTRL